MDASRLLLDPCKQSDDLRLIHRAMAQRWDIPIATKRIVLERLVDIAENGPADIALKAISELRHMESQNQKDEHKVIDVGIQLDHYQMAAIAAEIGVDESIVVDAQRIASGDAEDAGGEGCGD